MRRAPIPVVSLVPEARIPSPRRREIDRAHRRRSERGVLPSLAEGDGITRPIIEQIESMQTQIDELWELLVVVIP